MQQIIPRIIVTASILAFSAPVIADYVTIFSSDDPFSMYAGDIDGILGGSNNQFSMSDFDILNETLNDDGIETQGMITFILTNTDAGLSFIGLFGGFEDDYSPSSSDDDNLFLNITSTTPINTDWFASGSEDSEIDWYNNGDGTQTVDATLGWDGEDSAAGFAWADVPSAPWATFTLTDIDLTEFESEPIQFLTFDDDEWSVANTAEFTVLGEYEFSYQYIPAPGALGLLAVAGLVGRRQRRRS